MGFEYLTNIPLAKAREDYFALLESHGFAINPRRTMFYGLCEKCREAAQ